jgi:hypothetical protein
VLLADGGCVLNHEGCGYGTAFDNQLWHSIGYKATFALWRPVIWVSPKIIVSCMAVVIRRKNGCEYADTEPKVAPNVYS